MYCQIDERDNGCPGKCCRLYNVALGFLAVLVLFIVGLLIGANFATTFTAVTPILITAAVILAIIFIVTLLTRGCCNNSNE